MKNENEIKLSRTEFMIEFLETVCVINEYLVNIAKCAKNYAVRFENESELMTFHAYDKDYEIDTTIGAYRFKCNNSGPWTKWICVEGS